MYTKNVSNQTLVAAIRVAADDQVVKKSSIANRIKGLFSRTDLTLAEWENLEFRGRRISRGGNAQREF